MADADARKPSGPVIGMVVVILAILGLGFWFLARDRDRDARDVATVDALTPDSLADSPAAAGTEPGRSNRDGNGVGAGLPAEAALFAGRDIHDVPLGEILDHARTLTYAEARGHEMELGPNQAGRTVRVKLWPYAGASSLEADALGQGRIIARIESNVGYEKLGLADGLNYLWVESRPGGGYRGVVIPATAFVPLHDLDQVAISERTPGGVPLEKGAYWVNGSPWIACGRC